MALIPFAEKKLIHPGSSDPPIIPIGVILHVDAGNAYDLYDFFKNRSGGIESHGHIAKDGKLFQYRDTGYEADANYKANSFVKGGKRYGYLSFETQGFGPGEWTTAQLETIKDVLLWAKEVHSIPMRVCQNSQDPGVGYHTLFGSPSAWTPVAKSCPGPDRIKQFNNIIVPWMKSGGKKEEEMSWDEKLGKWSPGDDNPNDTMQAGKQLNQARGFSQAAYKEARQANNKAARIEKAVKALAKGLGPEVERAVEEALKDAVIEVEVNVNSGSKTDEP